MPRDHDYFVYIVTNYTQTVLYIGVTSDLEGRLWEHANGEVGSQFTKRYHVGRLLFFEHFGDVHAAIAREKQLKGWTRAKKEALIRAVNPGFEDLGVKLGLRGVRPETEGSATDDAGSVNKGVCRQPEDPSTALVPRSAQDDRHRKSRLDDEGGGHGLEDRRGC